MSGKDETGLGRAIWAIALPSMLTNVATALFGLADLWVIGRLGDAPLQAGVEIGAKFMMGLLVMFNFLRTGTIALTAQAAGRGAEDEQAATLARALGLGLLIGLILLAGMPLLIPAGLDLLGATGAARDAARDYVEIRYWGGSLWLANAALVGWLIARKRVKAVLWIEIVANLAHVALDLFLVLGLGWGVAGVAAATLISEAVKLLATAIVAAQEPPARALIAAVRAKATWTGEALGSLLRLNRDLFLRTFLLTLAILLVVRDGAQEGAVIVAANAILYQLFILSALLLDGFESAAQVLCGEAIGARDRLRFVALIRANLVRGFACALVITLVYAVAGEAIASSFTTNASVQTATRLFLPWAILMPLAGMASYVFDGIYVGATWTRALLLTMTIAFAVYGVLLLTTGPLGNHGLWLSFCIFLVVRAMAQAALLPRLIRHSFG